MNECLRVQMDGTKVCEECPLYQSDACGGQNILETGRNQKKYKIGKNGLLLHGESENNDGGGKKKKKKKK
jgi:hypothetical protein